MTAKTRKRIEMTLTAKAKCLKSWHTPRKQLDRSLSVVKSSTCACICAVACSVSQIKPPQQTSALNIWQVFIVSSDSMRSMMLYGIRLSPPHGMYFILSLMMTGAMSCSQTSLVLGVKVADLLVPGIGATDVGGEQKKSLMSCFFRAKI